MYLSSRHFRNNFSRGDGIVKNLNNPSNFAKVASSCYGSEKNTLFRVQEDGDIIIGKKAYADDVVAFVLGCISSNPSIPEELKDHLRRFVDGMDQRALSRHGYSDNEIEKNYKWEMLKQ